MSSKANFHFELDLTSGILMEKVTGFVTEEEILYSFTLKKKVPGYTPNVKMLCDYRDVEFKIGDEGIKKVVDFVKKNEAYFGKTKWAVITSNPLALAFARIYTILTHDSIVQTRAFSKLEEGRAWLLKAD